MEDKICLSFYLSELPIEILKEMLIIGRKTGVSKRSVLRLKRNWSRMLAVLLLSAVLLPLGGRAALAEEAGIPIVIGTGIKEQPKAEVRVSWDDAWFREDPAVYRHDLALAAMALSGAAYVRTDRGISARAALEDLGFEHLKSYHYQLTLESGEQTAYTFGVKTLRDGEGKTFRLVAAVVRGTGEYMEWAGNLNVGTGIVHAGFDEAGNELMATLKKYLAENGGENPVKFLITGHSRGGAVANLTAARLVKKGLAEKENVYAYTFAAPAVSAGAAEEGYENIFNIINEADLVPWVPLPDWGYRRYGVDVPLPAAEEDGYDALFEKMDQQYTALTGQPYAVYQDEKAVGKITDALHRLIPTVPGENMEMIAALLSGDLEGLSGLARQNGLAAILLGRTAVQVSSELTPLLRQERPGMVSAHCMAGYFSWLSVCSPA